MLDARNAYSAKKTMNMIARKNYEQRKVPNTRKYFVIPRKK